jgi:hypothetical protein
MGIYDELRGWNAELIDEIAARLGATCKLNSSLMFSFNLHDANFYLSDERSTGV